MGYKYLLDIALILLFTKVLGLLFQRLHMPQVVGSLIAGLLLGPAVLNFVQETEFLELTASLGVIVLMFISGMETDIHELKTCGKAAAIIAVSGVLVPWWAAGRLGPTSSRTPSPSSTSSWASSSPPPL